MRGPLVWIVAVAAGIVLVLVVTALIGDRDRRGETVTAGEWAQNVCGAVGVWRGEMEAIVEDVRTPSAVERPRRRGAAVGDAAGPDGLRPQGPRARGAGDQDDGRGRRQRGHARHRAGRGRRRTQVSDWASGRQTTSRRRRTRSTTRRTPSRSRSSSSRSAAGAIASVLVERRADDRRRGGSSDPAARRCAREPRARASSCERRRADEHD